MTGASKSYEYDKFILCIIKRCIGTDIRKIKLKLNISTSVL